MNHEMSWQEIHDKELELARQDRLETHPQPERYDPVAHPLHYNSHPSGVECKTITRHMNFNLGNAIKYIWRFSSGVAPRIQDLKKAVEYLNDEIERLGDKHEH